MGLDPSSGNAVGAARADGFLFVSSPNASLSHAQQRVVFWAVALPCFGIAAFFAALGYWLALPFAGLEIGVLAWAFDQLRVGAADFESLALDGDSLVLKWRAGTSSGRRDFNRQWVSVSCECRHAGHDCRLGLRSHGRTEVLGRHLSDAERCALARRLRAWIHNETHTNRDEEEDQA